MFCRWRVILLFVLIYIGRGASESGTTVIVALASVAVEDSQGTEGHAHTITTTSISMVLNSSSRVSSAPTNVTSATIEVTSTEQDRKINSTKDGTTAHSSSMETVSTATDESTQENAPTRLLATSILVRGNSTTPTGAAKNPERGPSSTMDWTSSHTTSATTGSQVTGKPTQEISTAQTGTPTMPDEGSSSTQNTTSSFPPSVTTGLSATNKPTTKNAAETADSYSEAGSSKDFRTTESEAKTDGASVGRMDETINETTVAFTNETTEETTVAFNYETTIETTIETTVAFTNESTMDWTSSHTTSATTGSQVTGKPTQEISTAQTGTPTMPDEGSSSTQNTTSSFPPSVTTGLSATNKPTTKNAAETADSYSEAGSSKDFRTTESEAKTDGASVGRMDETINETTVAFTNETTEETTVAFNYETTIETTIETTVAFTNESTIETTVETTVETTPAPTSTNATETSPISTTTETTPISSTSVPSTTAATSTTTTPSLEIPPPNANAVEIVSGILGVLLLAGLLATAAVMYRRGKLPWNPKNSNASVRPLPIALSKFETHCNELLETQGRLGSEFQLLQALSVDISDTNTFTAAQLPDNKKKNRYTNILPYDATRVILDVINEDPSSDYINASFVKGFSNTYEYIASQGPKEETISDFWRMVHQHDVQVIVMVTNWEEGGKPKCDHYLPKLRDQIYSGDMVVRCGTELVFPVYTQRTIVLHKGSLKRNIAHLHFNEWPDFGCPDSTESMLQFCRTLRHQVSLYPPGMVLVHCSAGVGRTGTLIAVDILLQQIQESKKVDVFGTVFKLRKHRTNMVQTKGQYEYIYKCIRDAVKDPTFLKSDGSPASSLEPIYENVPTTLTTFLYEKVPHKVAKSNSSESECEL